MKAITIVQPWATLIALGEKQFETRNWRTYYRGPLAIHAGKKINIEACNEETIKSILEKHGYTIDMLPTCAIVAIANLTECWSIGSDYQNGMSKLCNGADEAEKSVSLKETKLGFYHPCRYAWELSDIQQLQEPISMNGKQSLWNWDQSGGTRVE